MSQQVFLDTDILIDFGQDNSEAVKTIAELESNYDFCISVIVAMELYTGCRSKKDLSNLDAFLSDFEIIFFKQKYFKASIHVDAEI